MVSLYRRGFLSACLSVVALVASVSVASARPITGVVAFGDSLSDTGNASAAAAGIGLSFPVAPYAPGRLSNGDLWVEQFADTLGVPLQSNAFAGALTTNTNVFPGFPGMSSQVASYISANPAVNPDNLYTVFGGANDIFELLRGNAAPTPIQSAQNIAGFVSNLIGAGAKELLVPNLPNLGATPGVAGAGGAIPGNNATLLFNGTLAALLDNISLANPTVNIRQVDLYSTFEGLVAAPGAFGLTNVTQSYIDSQGQPQGIAPTISAAGLAAGSPAGFLFWDEVHPTTLGHSFIAQSALATVVPESGAMGLFAVGASVLGSGAVARRRRK